MFRAKHSLLATDSPSSSRKEIAPAVKRRKMQTPARRLRPQDFDRLGEADESRPEMLEEDWARSARKTLFSTPDRGSSGDRKHRRFASDLFTPSCSKFGEDELLRTNVNPFFPMNDSSGTPSGCNGDGIDHTPASSNFFSSPSTGFNSSRRLSRSDSVDSNLCLDSSPVMPAQLSSAFDQCENKENKGPNSLLSPAQPALSPGLLCRKLRRTCSLVSHNGSESHGDESECNDVSFCSDGSEFPQRCRTPSRLARTNESDEGEEEEEEEVLLDEEENSTVENLRVASSSHSKDCRAHGVGKGLSKTPQPPPPEPPTKANHRRNTFGGHENDRDGKHYSRFNEEFETKGVLGGGSFGTVYKCRNRLDGCMYAVKVTKQQFKGKSDRERVLKEVYALSALCNSDENPHIVRYFSAFIEDGHLYIQTELCDHSLQDIMNKRRYPSGMEAVAKDMTRQVLEGLSKLHRLSLVHLDIKPANIFVKNGVFKVGDLGHACLARIHLQNQSLPNPPPLSSSSSSGSKEDLSLFDVEPQYSRSVSILEDVEEGDSRYLAPEIIREEYNNLPKGDIFSLGVSVYEMCLERELPKNGEEWLAIRKGVLDGACLSRFSAPMRELVRLMLLPEPERRPSAEALLVSGGPNGILRTEWEAKLAREKATADAYRRQLARLQHAPAQTSSSAEVDDDDDRFRFKRSNTM